MILLDVNLLVYAKAERFPQHARAKEWMYEQMNGGQRVGIPWTSIAAFLRVMTQPRVLERPLTTEVALQHIAEWLNTDNVWIPGPTDAHREIFSRMLMEGRATGGKVHDAELAALAIEHGLVLCSADRDFARFPGLRWLDPFSPSPPSAAERATPFGADRSTRKRVRAGVR